jgi:hypothetical protein
MAGKTAMYGETDQKDFGLLRVSRVELPNGKVMFTLTPAGRSGADSRFFVELHCTAFELLAELRRISTWLEAQP